jgi:hypothetical protein
MIALPKHEVENLPSADAIHPWFNGYEDANLNLIALFAIMDASMSPRSVKFLKTPPLLVSISSRVIEFLGLRQALIHSHCLMHASLAMRSLIGLAVVLSLDSSACRSRSRRWLRRSFGASSFAFCYSFSHAISLRCTCALVNEKGFRIPARAAFLLKLRLFIFDRFRLPCHLRIVLQI